MMTKVGKPTLTRFHKAPYLLKLPCILCFPTFVVINTLSLVIENVPCEAIFAPKSLGQIRCKVGDRIRDSKYVEVIPTFLNAHTKNPVLF